MTVVMPVYAAFRFAVLVAPLRARRVLVLVLVMVAMSHLNARSTATSCEGPATTHETVSAEVGNFKRGELTGDLPVLRDKEYGCPGELKSRP